MLAINIDEPEIRMDLKTRLSGYAVQYENFFADDFNAFAADLKNLTGNTLRAFPSWLIFKTDGSLLGMSLGNQFNLDAIDAIL